MASTHPASAPTTPVVTRSQTATAVSAVATDPHPSQAGYAPSLHASNTPTLRVATGKEPARVDSTHVAHEDDDETDFPSIAQQVRANMRTVPLETLRDLVAVSVRDAMSTYMRTQDTGVTPTPTTPAVAPGPADQGLSISPRAVPTARPEPSRIPVTGTTQPRAALTSIVDRILAQHTPMFTGVPRDYHAWVSEVESYLNTLGALEAPPSQGWRVLVPSFVAQGTDAARYVQMAVVRHETWHTLRADLDRHFQSRYDASVILSELCNTRYAAHHTPATHEQHLRKLLAQVEHLTIDDILSWMVRQSYPKELTRVLLTSHPDASIPDMYALARQWLGVNTPAHSTAHTTPRHEPPQQRFNTKLRRPTAPRPSYADSTRSAPSFTRTTPLTTHTDGASHTTTPPPVPSSQLLEILGLPTSGLTWPPQAMKSLPDREQTLIRELGLCFRCRLGRATATHNGSKCTGYMAVLRELHAKHPTTNA